MSVTFSSNGTGTRSFETSPCLCAQMADLWVNMLDGEDSAEIRADLASEAMSDCPHCKGTGVESVPVDDLPEVNLSNSNARILLQILGLNDLFGDMPMPEARRAVMRAKNRKSLADFARNPEEVYGKPRMNPDGTVQLRPLRSFDQGLSEEGIQDRVQAFAAFVEESAARGATTISWG